MAGKKNVNYNEMSVEELRQEAAYRNIEGRSSMHKSDLVAALEADDQPKQAPANSASPKGTPAGEQSNPPTKDQASRPTGEGHFRASSNPAAHVGTAGVKKGTLHSVATAPDGSRQILLMKEDGTAGDSCALHGDDPTVELNGKETWLDDLRRGDELAMEGDPVQKITATRH